MPKTIIFLDNDEDFLNVWSRLLTSRGYDVLQAQSLEEAKDILRTRRVHLAIFDIRAQDDDDTNDVSGLNLTLDPAYLIVPKIVLTAFPHYTYATKAMKQDADGQQPALTLLDKADGPQKFLDTVADAFITHVRINWDLPIRFSHASSFIHLVTLIDPDIPAEWLIERAAELEDLFRKLFYANEQITVGRVLRQDVGQIEVEVYAYGGNEHKGQFVVACGKRDIIQEEKSHYKEGTPGNTDIGSTDLADHKETMRFGIIAYRLMGGSELEDMETLDVYYRRHDIDEVKLALEHLYNGSLSAWHKEDKTYLNDVNFSNLYLEWLGLDGNTVQESLARKVKALCEHALRIVRNKCSSKTLNFHLKEGEDDVVKLPNPVQTLADNTIEFEQPVLSGVTHGRVNTKSVLVDRTGRTWLIGFRYVQNGPLMRDFVYLEDALRTYFVRGMTLGDFYMLEQRLLGVESLYSEVSVEGFSYEQTKLVKSVMQIRRLAAHRAGDDLKLYLAGLLATALAHIHTFDETVKYYSTRELMPFLRSLMQAAMLTEKLLQLSRQDVRNDLPQQALDSLWIDKKTGQVWVEGRNVELSAQELQLLTYFYNHPGELRTKKQVLKEGLGDPSELYHVRSKLDNAISRLRKKIEPNPKDPKYLKTVHGRGFRFEI